ncbi:MAG: hypothetical protein Q8L85_10265 [Alphaproteobacteria bacterium]|nr:hypothetical protein [Alphaproteobacteria bacterium]
MRKLKIALCFVATFSCFNANATKEFDQAFLLLESLDISDNNSIIIEKREKIHEKLDVLNTLAEEISGLIKMNCSKDLERLKTLQEDSEMNYERGITIIQTARNHLKMISEKGDAMYEFVKEKINSSDQSLFYDLKINHLTECIEGLTSAQKEAIEYKKLAEAKLNS